MKRKKQKPDECAACDLDDRQIEILEKGFDFEQLLDDPHDEYIYPFESDEAERAAWEKNKDFILERIGPGARPFAWLKFEGKEPKLKGETDPDYLTRTNQWADGEFEAYQRIKERSKNVIDLADFQDERNDYDEK